MFSERERSVTELTLAMKASAIFAPINWSLFFYGNSVYRSNQKVVIASAILRFINIMCALRMLFYIVKDPSQYKSVLVLSGWATYYITAIISTLLLLVRRHDIKSLHVKIISLLSTKSRLRLHKHALIIFVAYLLMASTILFLEFLTNLEDLLKQDIVSIILDLFTNYEGCWYAYTTQLYYLFLSSLYIAEIEYFERNPPSMLKSTRRYRLALVHRQMLNRLNYEVDQVMSPFAFLFYVNIFTTATAYITQWSIQVAALLECIVILIVIMPIPLYIDFISKQIAQKGSVLIDTLTAAPYSDDIEFKERLIEELRSTTFTMTGWGMFALDKPFILSFTGTVLTFSLLLKQFAIG